MNNRPAAITRNLDRLAGHLGRLHKRDPDNWIIHQASDNIEQLDILLQPTAADLVRGGYEPELALRAVDQHTDRLKRKLGRGN